jgi:hypothetical protein
MRSPWVGSSRLGSILVVWLVLLGLGGTPARAAVDPGVQGQWSSLISLGIIGIHAAVLPTGKVLFYEIIRGPGGGTIARLWDPATNDVTVADVPFARSMMCAGMSFMADGRLMNTGGEKARELFPVGTGIKETTVFDPFTEMWSDGGDMQFDRWYPTNVMLPDGQTLVVGGQTAPPAKTHLVAKVESYDPASGAWTVLPPSADLTGVYPRLVLMRTGDVLKAGIQRKTMTFDPDTNSWTPVDAMNFGNRRAGGVVLLPGSHEVLTAGGQSSASGVTNTAEILDMSDPRPQWAYTDRMAFARMHANLVLLADGTVLAVGGGQDGNFGSPVKTAELYDPSTGNWSTMATQAAKRTYHSTALLLPDGRVMSAGSNTKLSEQTKIEIYSPPYLFHGFRPVISSVPSTVGYGAAFDIQTTQASDISRVAFVKLSSTTHGVNVDQRYVDLSFTKETGVVHATAPGSANLASPGYYMLFVLNSSGVPSIARIVRVG